jgi:broad-specificity NMP kinase
MNKELALLINGPPGVGKSSVAFAISDILSVRNFPHAVIDLDYLRYAYPRPQDDPHNYKLGLKNLASIWTNYKNMGVRCLIVPLVVEDQRELEDYHDALADIDVVVIRLLAKVEIVQQRLKNRKSHESLAWHLQRAEELIIQFESNQFENFAINTNDKDIETIAEEILAQLGLVRGKNH